MEPWNVSTSSPTELDSRPGQGHPREHPNPHAHGFLGPARGSLPVHVRVQVNRGRCEVTGETGPVKTWHVETSHAHLTSHEPGGRARERAHGSTPYGPPTRIRAGAGARAGGRDRIGRWAGMGRFRLRCDTDSDPDTGSDLVAGGLDHTDPGVTMEPDAHRNRGDSCPEGSCLFCCQRCSLRTPQPRKNPPTCWRSTRHPRPNRAHRAPRRSWCSAGTETWRRPGSSCRERSRS